MTRFRLLAGALFLGPALQAAEVKVSTLHPLLTDLAQRVGGERVEVVDLLGANGDPHKFKPGPRELTAAKGSQLYLLSGKGLEPYVDELRSIVGADRVIEVGKTLPTLTAETLCDHGDHAHTHETDDPHWWHSVDCWRRAARVVAKAFAKVDPAGAATYQENARKVRADLNKLDAWVRAQLGVVPRESRILATAHAAFAYFCHEYQWRMLPVQGLNREQVAAPQFVSEVAATIRKEKILAVFPERHSNPKMLKTLAESVGVRIGEPLMADGSESIEGMFRHNVKAIVAALAPAE